MYTVRDWNMLVKYMNNFRLNCPEMSLLKYFRKLKLPLTPFLPFCCFCKAHIPGCWSQTWLQCWKKYFLCTYQQVTRQEITPEIPNNWVAENLLAILGSAWTHQFHSRKIGAWLLNYPRPSLMLGPVILRSPEKYLAVLWDRYGSREWKWVPEQDFYAPLIDQHLWVYLLISSMTTELFP